MPRFKTLAPVLSAILLLGGIAFELSDSGDTASSTLRSARKLVPEMGVVTFVEGDVEVRHPDGDWEPLYAGDRVHPEDAIRSGSSGRVELAWEEPGRLLRIENASLVVLSGGELGHRLAFLGIEVESGAVWSHISGRRPFSLSGRDIVAKGIRATQSMRVGPDQGHLSVYTGQVRANGSVLKGGRGMISTAEGLRQIAVSMDDDLRDGWRDISDVISPAKPAVAPEAPETTMLTQDLRDLNPEIYLGVEVELTGKDAGEAAFEAEAARIRKIKVKSSRWDGMLPENKVKLLNDTFAVLKNRYPTILKTVVLEFDDDRPRLSLKYAAAG